MPAGPNYDHSLLHPTSGFEPVASMCQRVTLSHNLQFVTCAALVAATSYLYGFSAELSIGARFREAGMLEKREHIFSRMRSGSSAAGQHVLVAACGIVKRGHAQPSLRKQRLGMRIPRNTTSAASEIKAENLRLMHLINDHAAPPLRAGTVTSLPRPPKYPR